MLSRDLKSSLPEYSKARKLLRWLGMDSNRPQVGVFLAQRAFDLLSLNMCLAQGDIRVEKGVQHEIEFLV